MGNKLLNLKFYSKALFNMHVTRQSRLSYMPEYIAIEATNACNFKCKFCPQSDPDHHSIVPLKYLSVDDCELYLSKVREAGIKTNVMRWTLDGEPFMNANFHKLVNVATKFGFTNAFFASNGMLCTVERIVKFKLDKVKVTITIDFCADKNYFESVRGTPGSWNVCLDNILSIVNDPRTRDISIIITDISSFSESNPEKLSDGFRRLKELIGKNANVRYRTRTFHNATGFGIPSAGIGGCYHLCPYPWTHLRIASNGDVVICCRDLNHKTVLGNLRTSSVHEIWNGIKMLNARTALLNRTPSRVSACAGCDMPYDDSKFTANNYITSIFGRLQIFSK